MLPRRLWGGEQGSLCCASKTGVIRKQGPPSNREASKAAERDLFTHFASQNFGKLCVILRIFHRLCVSLANSAN